MSLILIICIISLIISILTGVLLQYVFKDMSRNTGFLISDNNQYNIMSHIIIGIIVGLLIFPFRYKSEILDNSCQPFNKFILIRQTIGGIIFMLYTSRNFYKHPLNLYKALNNDGKYIRYGFYKSSVTRQQVQLSLGISLSILLMLYVTKKQDKKIENMSNIFFIVFGFSLFQIIAQFYNEHDMTNDIVENLVFINKMKKK